MHPKVATSPRWTTASIPDATATAPMELQELGAHVNRCNGCRSRWFAVRCTVDSVHDFLTRRIVTTLFVAGVAIVLGALAL